ncbi:MAG: Lrp/AsnC family transcriptional regulator [Rhizobiales bacterium]|nr:Lrp/AsnC family transcriptional regulator [Hyphomicrobiales bacterium]
MPKLDATDLRILTEIQHDAGLTNVELAARVGLSPSPCLARVRALEAAGVIARRVALLDAARLGPNVSMFVEVTLEKQTEAALNAFESAMRGFPEVMECYLMTGNSDYLLRVVVRDAAAFRDFVLDRLTTAPGVANIRSSIALKQVKYQTSLPLAGLIAPPAR